MKLILLVSIVTLVSVEAQKDRIRVFGDYGSTACAPVTKCPYPCRLGKETTGCALCVCPPACRFCYSGCYLPSRPDECPYCAPSYQCDGQVDSDYGVFPGLGPGPGIGFGLGR